MSLILIIFVSYGILIFSYFRDSKNRSIKNLLPNLKLTKHDYVVLLIIILLILVFSNITAYIGWAPGVDSISHGLLTNLLLNNQRLTSTLEPVAPSQPWFEPFGFHIISANISLFMNMYPGQSVFLFSTVVTILTIISCFTIVYYCSKSILLSLISMISCFLIFSNVDDIRFLEKWFLGFFYNTPYANLFGFFFLIQFFFVYFVMNDLRINSTKVFLLALSLSIVGILVSYSPFVVIPASYIILSWIYKLFEHYSVSKRLITKLIPGYIQKFHDITTLKVLNMAIILLLIFGMMSICNFIIDQLQDSNNNFFILLNRIKNNSYFYSSIVLNPSSFSDLAGYWSIILLLVSVISIVKYNRVQISYFYLTVTSILTISSFSFQILNEMLWFILGGRLFVFMILLNGIVTAIYIYDFTRWISKIKRLKIEERAKDRFANYLQIILSFLIIIAFIPSVVSNASLEQATFWGWQVASLEFQNDYKIFDWISKNINKTDLILTDYTFTSKRLMSFSLHNVTAIPIPISPKEIELGKDTVIVWDKPTLLKSFIDRYDVKYVILDSDYNHRVPAELGGTDENVPRTYNSTEYKTILSNMPFLTPIKEFGDSALYKVNK